MANQVSQIAGVLRLLKEQDSYMAQLICANMALIEHLDEEIVSLEKRRKTCATEMASMKKKLQEELSKE